MIRKIKTDSYLKKFLDFCKQRYGKNLIAVGIYGSYAWGYFDKEKSDYDVFLIFNHPLKNEGEMLTKKFRKISVQYFCTKRELLNLIKKGHWAVYITFLKSARMLYSSQEYKIVMNKMKKIDFIKNLQDLKRIKFMAKFEHNALKKSNGYIGAKYAYPGLRSRLQLLTYIRYRKLIWDLSKVIKLNKDVLNEREQKLIMQLEKSVRERKNIFSDKKMAINLLDRLNERILYLLKINPSS